MLPNHIALPGAKLRWASTEWPCYFLLLINLVSQRSPCRVVFGSDNSQEALDLAEPASSFDRLTRSSVSSAANALDEDAEAGEHCWLRRRHLPLPSMLPAAQWRSAADWPLRFRGVLTHGLQVGCGLQASGTLYDSPIDVCGSKFQQCRHHQTAVSLGTSPAEHLSSS